VCPVRFTAGALAAVAFFCAASCGDGTTATAPDVATRPACTAPPLVGNAPADPADWPVYHGAGDRHGVDSRSPHADRLSPLWGAQLDGATFAQPLVAGGLVVEVTAHDSVYAFDADSGCLAWRTNLGASYDASKLDCPNLIPEVGVTATPAIDPATGTVYVVAYLAPGRFEMDALRLQDGAIQWRHPIVLPNANPLYQLNRPALALANGRVYAAFGSRLDCSMYHGYVVGVRSDGSGPDAVFQVTPNRGGAVWAPGGPVVLPNGHLLVPTANSDGVEYDNNNAVIRLTPELRKADLFAPSNWASLNESDVDLGSVGPTFLDPDGVFQVGKEGVGYLLALDNLGGIGGQRYASKLDGGCYAIGTTAYRAPLVYVPCDHGVKAVRVGSDRFDVAWTGPDMRSGSPILAGGLLWDIEFERGYLWGLDPDTGQVKQKVAVGTAEHFVSPGASAGRLFVPAGRRLLAFSFGS
jgi:outer membrane protein assembly factor BamB